MAIAYFIKEKFYPEEPPIKIGEDKSMTWCFGLYVYKKHVIHTLQDWIPIFSHSSRIIIDQFNTLYTPDLMISGRIFNVQMSFGLKTYLLFPGFKTLPSFNTSYSILQGWAHLPLLPLLPPM